MQPNECMLVAAHGWDVAGAHGAGLQTAFVARERQQKFPWPSRQMWTWVICRRSRPTSPCRSFRAGPTDAARKRACPGCPGLTTKATPATSAVEEPRGSRPQRTAAAAPHPAQHDSWETSCVKVWAASFRPSTMVR